MKRTVKIKESELRRLIAESVRRVLRESEEVVFVGFKTWDNEKFQQVIDFLQDKGLPVKTEETYTRPPHAVPGTYDYNHSTLSGGKVYIMKKFAKEEAYELAQELFDNFGRYVIIDGKLCQDMNIVDTCIKYRERWLI